METYRHIRHAGNFADVVKHVVLAVLVEALQRRSDAISLIDTHAGAGRYDLSSRAAMRKGEWQPGIGRVVHATDPPPGVNTLLQAITELNESGELRFYPGSPWIIRSLLRSQDYLLAFEIDPPEFALLEREFDGDSQVETRCQDGYHALRTCLPPAHQSGLVLIDPTFQQAREHAQLMAALRQAYRRWPTGTFAAWYPITARGEHNRLHTAVGGQDMGAVVAAELTVASSATDERLLGCGMLLVNAPADLDTQLQDVLSWLWKHLALDPSSGANINHISVHR